MRKLAILTTLVAVGSVASAQLYFQNPHTPGAAGANGLSGFQGNLGVPTTVYDRELADDFTVTGPGWLVNRTVSNWIQFTPGDANPVTAMNIDFYNKTGGTVGSLVASRVGTVIRSTGPGTYFGRPEQLLDSSFAPVLLTPGSYYVMIQAMVNHNWFWLTSTPTTPIAGTSAHFRRGPGALGGTDPTFPTTFTPTAPGDVFVGAAHDVAFQLHGSPVPEPASMAVLGLGALALIRKRRKTA